MDTQKYQMKPGLENSFRITKIKAIVQSVLQETLEGKTYTEENALKWTKELSDKICQQIKDLEMQRYKHVVQILFVQQTGAGCKYIARCHWDAECDSQISEYFANESFVCVVSIFGIYFY